jgi:uncharacterized membrane protein
VSLLNFDVIPNNWSDEPYKSKPIPQESLRKAMGIYSVLILLGAETLSTAIGIFFAAMFGLGIRVYSLPTLYRAAFCLGLLETIISILFSLRGVGAIATESLALGLVSAVIKGFQIQWADGYRLVAAGALTIIAVRSLFE